MKSTQKIIIGGAQLGMHYGIANSQGQVNPEELQKIFELANQNGISRVDTAYAYGDSESVLGKFSHLNLKVITKLDKLSNDVNDIKAYVENIFFSSLKKLQQSSCEGLLVHNANDLLGPNGKDLYDALKKLKDENKVKKIGASVYLPEHAEALLNYYSLDIIQFPLNLFDQRFLQNNFLSRLKNQNVELHARSIFLQGLLLMDEKQIPKKLTHALPLIKAIQLESDKHQINSRKFLINFIKSIPELDFYIFGIDSSLQFQEIIDDFRCEVAYPLPYHNFKCDDLNLINPMNWPT